MAASVAASPTLQAQILGFILAPIATQWADPTWRQGVSSPLAFASKYMTLQQGPGGGFILGGR